MDEPVRADRGGDDLEVNQVAVRRPEVAGSPSGLAAERHRSPGFSRAGQLLWRNGLAVVDSAKVSGNGSRGLVLPGDEPADVVRVRGHGERTQCRLENRASIRRFRGRAIGRRLRRVRAQLPHLARRYRPGSLTPSSAGTRGRCDSARRLRRVELSRERACAAKTHFGANALGGGGDREDRGRPAVVCQNG